MIFNKNSSKFNSGIIKIPTLLGLIILLLGVIGGIYLVNQNQILKTRAAVSSSPKNVNVYNLSGSSAALSWQTDEAAIGFVKAGSSLSESKTYLDDRDSTAPSPHKLHFITLTNLKPQTTYSYQIYSGPTIYPDPPATFITSAYVPPLNWNPIAGTIIDSDNQPVSEALIILELNNAQKLASITKSGGNFILPLSDLKTFDLSKSYPESLNPYKAVLKITGPASSSQTTLFVPLSGSSLPPVILGKNSDLTSNYTEIKKYDLSGDNAINEVDLSIILKNFGSFKNTSSNSAEKLKADLNKDGIVDQKDADLIISYLK